MVIFVDPSTAVLRSVPDAMKERRLHELVQHLDTIGIHLTGGGEGYVTASLRELALKNGSLDRASASLFEALEQLGAVRVDCGPEDIGYLHGNNFESHAISRGLESGVRPLLELLTNIEPSELYSNLSRAVAFIYQDSVGDHDVQQALQGAAHVDLQNNGFLPPGLASADYRGALDANPAEDEYRRTMEATRNYQPAETQAWKSPFDTSDEA